MTDDVPGGRQLTSAAELLQAFLQRNGVTQVAAGLALGVSGPTIYDWVAGKKRPRTHHREAIALWTNGEVVVGRGCAPVRCERRRVRGALGCCDAVDRH
jgi:hypothetical protein